MSLSPGDITVSSTYKAMYAGTATVDTGGFATTDLLAIIGSATKTIRISKIAISGRRSSPGIIEVLLVKRSTADTGGSVILNTVSYSSLNPAATAVLRSIPSGIGSLVGIIRSTKLTLPLDTSFAGAAQMQYIWSFNKPSQELVLRGTSECIAINLNGAAILGSIFAVWVEWTEE